MMKLMEAVPALAATISFVVLTLAFAHEWAFYSIVGTDFQALMSVADYFNSAVSWLPWAGLGFLSAMLWRLSDKTRNVPIEVKEYFYKQNRFRWMLDRGPLWMFYFVAFFGGGFQILFGDWYTRGAIEILFIYLWVRFFVFLIDQESIAKALTVELSQVLLFVPLLFFMAYIGGLTEAASVISKKEPNFIGRLKGQYKERDWLVLRTLSAGVIIREMSVDRLQFVRWDDVSSFQKRIPQVNRNGLVCRMSGYLCRP